MNASEWSKAFFEKYGRNPEPDEFLTAKAANFPPLVDNEVERAQAWVHRFEETYHRKPTAEEYGLAKTRDFQEELIEENILESQEKPEVPWIQAFQQEHHRQPTPEEFTHGKQTGFDLAYLPNFLEGVQPIGEVVEQEAAKKKMNWSKKQLRLAALALLGLVMIGGGYYYLDQTTGADVVIENFNSQIQKEDYSGVAESFNLLDSKQEDWTAETAKDFVAYLNQSGSLQAELQKLETNPNYVIRDTHGNQLLALQEENKKLGLFPVYHLKTFPLTISAKSNMENISLNQQKLTKDQEISLGEFAFVNQTFQVKGKNDSGDLDTEVIADVVDAKENHITLSLNNVEKTLQVTLPSEVQGATDVKLYMNNKDIGNELIKKVKLMENQEIQVHAQFTYEGTTYTTDKIQAQVKTGEDPIQLSLILPSDVMTKIEEAKKVKAEAAQKEEENKKAINQFMTDYIEVMRNSIRSRNVGFTDYYDTNSEAYRVMYNYVANGGVNAARVDYQKTVEFSVRNIEKVGDDYKVTVFNRFIEYYQNGKSDMVTKNQVFMLRPEGERFKIYSISEY